MTHVFTLFALFNNFSTSAACETDVREIIYLVANEQQTAQHLNHYVSTKQTNIFFTYETPPLCNNSKSLIVKFKFPYKHRTSITYSNAASLAKRKAEKKEDAVIIIESLSIVGDTAIVKIRVPVEGVYGTFILRKQAKWKVVSTDIFEV